MAMILTSRPPYRKSDFRRGRGFEGIGRRVSASQGRNERQDITRDCQEQDRERTRNEQRDKREQPSLVPSHSHNAQSQSDDETQQAQRPYKGRNRTASARAQDDQQRQDPGKHLQDKYCHRAITHGRSLHKVT